MSIPATLYKFRGIERINLHLETLLRNRRLFLANPDTLNDPFDCLPYFLFPDDPEADIEKAAERLKHTDPQRTRTFLRAVAVSPSQTRQYEDTQREVYFRQCGVLCFASSKRDPVMWANYATSGRGFAVGYSTTPSATGERLDVRPVRYSRTRPSLSSLGTDRETRATALFSKSAGWRHEREWRLVRTISQGGSGYLTVPDGTIMEVLIGPKTAERLAKRIITLARALPDQPTIRRARLPAARYGIEFDTVWKPR